MKSSEIHESTTECTRFTNELEARTCMQFRNASVSTSWYSGFVCCTISCFATRDVMTALNPQSVLLPSEWKCTTNDDASISRALLFTPGNVLPEYRGSPYVALLLSSRKNDT